MACLACGFVGRPTFFYLFNVEDEWRQQRCVVAEQREWQQRATFAGEAAWSRSQSER